MEETSVDPDLEAFLKRPASNNAAKGNVNIKDDELGGEDEGNESDDLPCSSTQRERIYSLLSQVQGPNITPEGLATVEKIKKLSKREAEGYIECLKAVQNTKFSMEVTSRMVKRMGDIATHPKDLETVKELSRDAILISEFNVIFGEIFAKLGRLKGPFMFGVYCASSWLDNMNVTYNKRNFNPFIGGNEHSEQKGNHDAPPVQADGGRQVSDGKNHADGKTDGVLLG